MQNNPFAAAERGQTIAAREYRRQEPALQEALLNVQQTLRQVARFPVLLVFSGLETAGKGETLNQLNAWMDPRWLHNCAYGRPSDEERERPEFWRYWRDLPPKGQIGLFLGAWYYPVLHDLSLELVSEAAIKQRLRRIRQFETTLAADGALILKFWLHLDRERQLKRLRQLTEDPLQRWRVGIPDWQQWHYHAEYIAGGAHLIQATDQPAASWHIVEGWDERYRNLTIGKLIDDSIRQRLAATEAGVNPTPAPTGKLPAKSALRVRTTARKLGKAAYLRQLREQQAELNRWHRVAAERGLSTVLVFEGMDAAGKGGTIRRIVEALEARRYRVLPFAAPTDEESAHHYLWRFWRRLGRAGRFTLFDRSWYGRVLVERVEGLASPEAWNRAYEEINQFEADLTEHGLVLIKFWLQIDASEQLKRFRERQSTPHKHWKLTDADWRNHKRWDDYQLAAHDMLTRTSPKIAPWHIVLANDKRRARIEVIRTINRRLKETLHP